MAYSTILNSTGLCSYVAVQLAELLKLSECNEDVHVDATSNCVIFRRLDEVVSAPVSTQCNPYRFYQSLK